MASPPIITPSGTTGWNRNAYAAGPFEKATYQEQILVPIIEDGERLLHSMIIRKHQRVAGATLSASSEGTGLTYVNPVGTPVTISAGGLVVPIQWSENEDAQVDANLDQEAGAAGAAALAELIETNTAANATSFTQTVSNATADAATLRAAVAKLATNTNGMAIVGRTSKTVYGYFSTTQMVSLMGIPEVNSAEMRGDSENPYVKGIWVKGFGIMLSISSVVAQDANGYHNLVYLAESMTVRWNVRSRIKRQDVELANRWIGYANVGSGIVHDLRAVDVRTT